MGGLPGRGRNRIPYPDPLPARLLSLALAAVLAVLILVAPRAVADSVTEIHHGRLSLLMWGMAAGFIHGVGFVPYADLWRAVFHPFLGWLVMAGGVFWLLQ